MVLKGSMKRKPVGRTLARAAAVAMALAVLGFLALSGGRNSAGNVLAPGSVVEAASAEQTASPQAEAPRGEATENVQKVRTSLASGYEPITVTAGIPVEWTIDAPEGSIYGCNYVMVAPEFGVEHEFTPGENVIRFTPDKAGTYPYSCWMGMISSTITVVEPGAAGGPAATAAPGYTVPPISRSCCD
jgi:plastocyanin